MEEMTRKVYKVHYDTDYNLVRDSGYVTKFEEIEEDSPGYSYTYYTDPDKRIILSVEEAREIFNQDDLSIAVPEPVFKHDFDDVSYHGSPIWQCLYCGVYKNDKGRTDYCPKAEEVLKRKAKEKESAERYEYERLKKERERFAYLEAKFGKREDRND